MRRLRPVRTLLTLGVIAGLLGLAAPGSAMIEPGFPGGDAGALQTGVIAIEQPNPSTWYSVTCRGVRLGRSPGAAATATSAAAGATGEPAAPAR